VSWSFSEKYLPKAFHTRDGFLKAFTFLIRPPLNERSMVSLVLGVGLALRDIGRQQEIEVDDPPPGTPSWVIHSELDIQDIDTLLTRAELVFYQER
jgi:hypothetical protein